MSDKVIIIAEAGVNHNGSLETALNLIDSAAQAGADFIKFQTFITKNLVTKIAQKAEYQLADDSSSDNTQFTMLKKLEIPMAWYNKLIQRCKEKKIGFLSTGFDIESIDFLDQLNIPFFKVPSGEITNKPLLQHIASKGKPVILSSGMSTLDEIKAAISVIVDSGYEIKHISVLHCNTQYPTPFEDVNLNAMVTIRDALHVKVGYSDHTLGIEVPVAAVALGAKIIEKHFTLDKTMDGPDHKASIEPNELIQMVKSIRNIELAMGSEIKQPSSSEINNINIVRRSIHICSDITSGHIIKSKDLIMKRPGDGISPMEINGVIGKKVKNDLPADYKLKWEDLL